MSSIVLSTAYSAWAAFERVKKDACPMGFAFFFSNGDPCNNVSVQAFDLTFYDGSTPVLVKNGAAITFPQQNRLLVILTDADKAVLAKAQYTYTLFNITNQRTEVQGTFSWQKGRTTGVGVLSPPDLKVIYSLVTGDVSIGGLIVTGIQGPPGWSPVYASIYDGPRIVQKIVDWVGATGTKPAVGKYVGATGLVTDIALATDIRGQQGLPGAAGNGTVSIFTSPIDPGAGVKYYPVLTLPAQTQGTYDFAKINITFKRWDAALAMPQFINLYGANRGGPYFQYTREGATVNGCSVVAYRQGGSGGQVVVYLRVTNEFNVASALVTESIQANVYSQLLPSDNVPTGDKVFDTDDALYPPKLAYALSTIGGFGDFSTDGWLWLHCGDSTTEQMQGAGFGMDRITQLRASGDRLAGLIGHVNFGGSGYTLDGFVNQTASAIPVIPATGNKGIGNWDLYGHKPTGAISLSTALTWRKDQAAKVLWTLCFGINDVILYAATGNLTQEQITDYVASRLRIAVNRILTAYPKDKVMLRVPNPMTARPYSTSLGFPSATQYPNFGQNEATDQTLVEKWNQGLRNGYLQVRNEMPSTILFDTHERVFGYSNTTLMAATALKFLGDLVHPSALGYIELANQMVNLISPLPAGSSSRRREADERAAVLGGSPWEYYPTYFRDNTRYRRVLQTELVGIGANYIDIGVKLTDFLAQTQNGSGVYITIGSKAAQYFDTYNASAVGANTRLFSIAVSATMQANSGAGRTVEGYLEQAYQFVANDAYVDGQVKGAKEYYDGATASAGTGYIDFSINQVRNRISSKFAAGLIKGTLVIGGTVAANLSLATATQIARNGTNAQRSIRILIPGNYASYAGKPAAIMFSDDAPSPKTHEAVFAQRSMIPHAQNNRGLVHVPVQMTDGAKINAFLTEQIATTITVDVYSVKWPNRTLLGTISIGPNVDSAGLTSGNPSLVEAGSFFEYMITSGSSQQYGWVGLAVTPV
jgi:lysophospholipase L1-like esterase